MSAKKKGPPPVKVSTCIEIEFSDGLTMQFTTAQWAEVLARAVVERCTHCPGRPDFER